MASKISKRRKIEIVNLCRLIVKGQLSKQDAIIDVWERLRADGFPYCRAYIMAQVEIKYTLASFRR